MYLVVLYLDVRSPLRASCRRPTARERRRHFVVRPAHRGGWQRTHHRPSRPPLPSLSKLLVNFLRTCTDDPRANRDLRTEKIDFMLSSSSSSSSKNAVVVARAPSASSASSNRLCCSRLRAFLHRLSSTTAAPMRFHVSIFSAHVVASARISPRQVWTTVCISATLTSISRASISRSLATVASCSTIVRSRSFASL